jgi:tetrahydromethanopterin S-methyltransferase subunit E
MVDTVTIVLFAMAAIIATIFGIKRDSSKGVRAKPPPNEAAKVAREAAKKEFDDNIKALNKAVTGDSAANDLADLGNKRKR